MENLLPGLMAAENYHPLVVHFPIAFWVAASFAWVFSVVLKIDKVWEFGLWLQIAAVLSAGLAIGFGFWATDAMGHDSPGHDLVHVHRDWMIYSSIVSALLTCVAFWKRKEKGAVRLYLLIASLLVLTATSLGADRGAELVYSYGMGVAKTPPKHESTPHSHGSESSKASDDHHGGGDHAH